MKYSQLSLFCRIVKLNRKYGHLQDKGCFVSVMSCSGNCNNNMSKSQWTFCRWFYATAKLTYKTRQNENVPYVPCMKCVQNEFYKLTSCCPRLHLREFLVFANIVGTMDFSTIKVAYMLML